MNSERTQAYGRIVKTLEDLGPAKLLADEQQRIRDAADTLIFASGPDDHVIAALDDVTALCRAPRRVRALGRRARRRARRRRRRPPARSPPSPSPPRPQRPGTRVGDREHADHDRREQRGDAKHAGEPVLERDHQRRRRRRGEPQLDRSAPRLERAEALVERLVRLVERALEHQPVEVRQRRHEDQHADRDADHQRGERRVRGSRLVDRQLSGQEVGPRASHQPTIVAPTATAAVARAGSKRAVQTSANVARPATAETITATRPLPDVSPS